MGSGMGGAFSGNTGTANNNGNGNGIGASSGHATAASNGAEDFSDFQGSVGGSGGGGGGGETNGGSAVPTPTAAGGGGITNAKWRDVSSLVDLGGLSSNTDKKVSARAVRESWG